MLFAQYAVSTLFSADVTLIIVQKKYQCKAGASFVIGSCFYNFISYFCFTLWQGDIASADSNKKHECAATTIKNGQGTSMKRLMVLQ